MDKETLLWNQYDVLRDEIRGADSLNYQIMGVVVGACAAILVAGFNQTNPLLRCFISLCVFVVTYPGYQLLYSNRRRIWRVSTYMRVFIEPDLDQVKWETRLKLQRERTLDRIEEKQISSSVLRNEWFIITAMNTIAVIAAAFGIVLYYIRSQRTDFQLLISIFIGIVSLVLYFSISLSTASQEKELRRSGTIEENFCKSWEKIKSEEDRSIRRT